MAKGLKAAWIALAAGLSLGASMAAAKDDPPPRPKEIDALYACRAIGDAAVRLACFDRTTQDIQTADTAGEVIFADREQVKQARLGLFGLGNIRLGIFARGDNDPEDQELKVVEAGVRSIDISNYNRWVIVLENGARWAQTEFARIRPRTDRSKTVTIKRGALGSYTMVFDNGTMMKVKRVL